MALRVAVQMDPIESINIDGDSSFALMLAAQARGHRLWHYEVRHLVLREGQMKAGAARWAHAGLGDRAVAATAPAHPQRQKTQRASWHRCPPTRLR